MACNKKRAAYFLLFAALTVIEVLIALFVNDTILRPYGGDVIVVSVVYFFVRCIIPEKLRLLPLYVFLFADLIETLQYINILEILGFEKIAILQVILGTSFSWVDIGCYALGCVPLVAYEIVRYQREKHGDIAG